MTVEEKILAYEDNPCVQKPEVKKPTTPGFYALLDYKAIEESHSTLDGGKESIFTSNFASLVSEVLQSNNINLFTRPQKDFFNSYMIAVDDGTLTGALLEFDKFMGEVIDVKFCK